MTVRLLQWGGALARGGSAGRATAPYLVPAGAGLALAAALRRRPLPALAGLVAAGIGAARLVPRARPTAQPVLAGGRPLTVMTVNVLKGRAEPAALVALVRAHRPDVLALQEQHPAFLERLDRAGLRELLPHRVAGNGRRTNDAAILTRHPLAAGVGGLPTELVAAKVALPGGAPVPFISIHPLAPVGARREARWRRALAAVPAPRDAFAGGVVAGDFNATLDHPELRALLAAGWRDAGAERGAGLRPTWRALGGLAALTIDHVLAPPGAVVEGYAVCPVAGTDHRALIVRLRLP